MGVITALSGVALVVLWERLAYPSLLDFDSYYRTTALFWEMHVGGAAIDGFVAMSAPFVVWALKRANRPAHWCWVALLALLVCYAALTTFSRGVYLAVGLPLVLLGLRAWAHQTGFQVRVLMRRMLQWLLPKGWRGKASLVLALALALEIFGVFSGSASFMRTRMAQVELDFGSRVAHWQRGVSLLTSPLDWILGIGLGRLPAAYSALGPETEKPGSVRLRSEAVQGTTRSNFVHIEGPASNPDLGGLFGLTQRVDWVPGDVLQVDLRLRAQRNTEVFLKVCEKHVLYEGSCALAATQVMPSTLGWHWVRLHLSGETAVDWFDKAPPYAPRFAVMTVAVSNTGGAVDIGQIGLRATGQKDLLSNGDFAAGLAHWFPAAQRYYLPWHIDNLFLEVLIERGAPALLLSALGLVLAWVQLARAAVTPLSIAPYLAASLLGAVLVGLVSSMMDAPRIAFMFFLLTFFALHLKPDATCNIRD